MAAFLNLYWCFAASSTEDYAINIVGEFVSVTCGDIGRREGNVHLPAVSSELRLTAASLLLFRSLAVVTQLMRT